MIWVVYCRNRSKYTEEGQGNGFSYLARGEASIATVQARATDGDYNPDRIKLIQEAVIIQGVPFVRIEDVIECKTAYDRPKDHQDLEMIEEYLIGHPKPYEAADG